MTAVGIMPHHDIATSHGLHDFWMHGAGNSGGHTSTHRHGKKGRVNAITIRQAKADVRGATGGIHFELLSQASHQCHDLQAGSIDRANRHDEGIHNNIAIGYPVVGGAFDNFFSHREAHVGIL